MNIMMSTNDIRLLFGEKALKLCNTESEIGISVNKLVSMSMSHINNMYDIIKKLDIMSDVKLISIDGTEGSGKTTIYTNKEFRDKYIYEPLLSEGLINSEDITNMKYVKFPRPEGSYGAYFYTFLKQIDGIKEKAHEGMLRTLCICMACLDRLEWVLNSVEKGDRFLTDRSYISNLIVNAHFDDMCMKNILNSLIAKEDDIFSPSSILLLRDITYDISTDTIITMNQAIDRIRKSMKRDRGGVMTHFDKAYVEQNNSMIDYIQKLTIDDTHNIVRDKGFYRIVKK